MHVRSTLLGRSLAMTGTLALVMAAPPARGADVAGTTSVVPAPPPASVAALADCELAGVTGLGATLQVCIVEPRASRGRWLTVGVDENGWLAESYDADRRAVLLRVGGATRWVPLRGSSIAGLPVVHLADGRIDYEHMQLTDRQKELKASLQMWEMLEVSRLGRIDGPAAPQPGRRVDVEGSSSTSQPR